MKKLLLFTGIIFILSGMIIPRDQYFRKSTISISNPNQSSVWSTGKQYNIHWNFKGSSSLVSITLIKSLNRGSRLKTIAIAAKTNNDGVYSWKIPNNTESGKYYIKINAVAGGTEGKSEIFEIKKGINISPKNYQKILLMKIIKPNYASFWNMGTTYSIKWETNASGIIGIDLYTYNKKFVRNITTSSSQNGNQQFSWSVPTDLGIGKYKIKIYTLDKKISKFSDKFSIRGSLATKTYTVPVVFTSNKRKTTRKADDTNMECPSHVDPGPKKMRVGHATLATENLTCKTFYRSYAYFDLTPYQNKGLLMKAIIVTEKIAGGQSGGAYPNVLDEKWNGNALALFNVKTHRESSAGSGAGKKSSFKFLNTVRNWIAYPNQNYGVVFTVFNENGYQSGWQSVRHYTVHLVLEFLEQK